MKKHMMFIMTLCTLIVTSCHTTIEAENVVQYQTHGQLRLSLDKEKYAVGEPIFLEMTFTNTSKYHTVTSSPIVFPPPSTYFSNPKLFVKAIINKSEVSAFTDNFNKQGVPQKLHGKALSVKPGETVVLFRANILDIEWHKRVNDTTTTVSVKGDKIFINNGSYKISGSWELIYRSDTSLKIK